MKAPKIRIDSRWLKIGISGLAHLLVLLAFVHERRLWVAPMRLPGDAHGSRMLLTYMPGHSPAPSNMPVKVAITKPVVTPKTAVDRVPLPVKKAEEASAASTTAPAAAHPDGTVGDDALGTGNVNIALVRSYPSPKPDLSKLPRGTSGDVVVDIVIDAEGKITSVTQTKGLGFGVDEVVIATVQQWVFKPATKDGKPVASEQELHFHFERG